MVYVIHDQTKILGVEQSEDALSRYPASSKATPLPHMMPSLIDVKRNWRVIDGELIPRIIVSASVFPEVASAGENVSIAAKAYNLLPGEERESILFKLGDDAIKISLKHDDNMAQSQLGQTTYKAMEKGTHYLELCDWPDADYVMKVLVVV